jgi:hypothetical protein
MGKALLYYRAQTWTAGRPWQAQPGAPAQAATQARSSQPSPRTHRARSLPAAVARRVRTVLGGSP